MVEMVRGNGTSVELEEVVWSGRWVHLVIEGNKGDERRNAMGASVAEWSLVVEGEE